MSCTNSQDQSQCLSFRHMGSWKLTWSIRFGCKRLYPLSPLTTRPPIPIFFLILVLYNFYFFSFLF